MPDTPPGTPKRLTRLQVMLTDAELTLLDDFRFEKRMPSRAAAVREILRRGLIETDEDETVDAGAQSSDFGVASQETMRPGDDSR